MKKGRICQKGKAGSLLQVSLKVFIHSEVIYKVVVVFEKRLFTKLAENLVDEKKRLK